MAKQNENKIKSFEKIFISLIPPSFFGGSGGTGSEAGATFSNRAHFFRKKFGRSEAMTRRVTTKETIKRRTIRDMKELGIHKPQYNRIIDIYSELVHQYLLALKEFEEGGYQYEVPTGTGGTKKSGIVSAMENLRKDILQYADRLGLTPKGFESLKNDESTKEEKKTGLAEILSKLDDR